MLRVVRDLCSETELVVASASQTHAARAAHVVVGTPSDAITVLFGTAAVAGNGKPRRQVKRKGGVVRARAAADTSGEELRRNRRARLPLTVVFDEADLLLAGEDGFVEHALGLNCREVRSSQV